MKALCTESDTQACEAIIRKLADAGIEAETRPRVPSLFDPEDTDKDRDLFEVWAVNEEDLDRAREILYPSSD